MNNDTTTTNKFLHIMGRLKDAESKAALQPQQQQAQPLDTAATFQALIDKVNSVKGSGGAPPQVALPTYPEPAVSTVPQELNPASTAAADPNEHFLLLADRLYKAFSHAETGGEENPWRRTRYKPKGDVSTAFGPVQVTMTLMKDAMDRKDHLLNNQEEIFAKRFVSQGERFMKARDNHPVYGYGGTGFLKTKNDRIMYERVAKKLLLDAHLRSKEDLGKTIKKWRGVEDPNYERKVRAAFYKN
jgi:hypothetical protein